jgi:DNA-binding Xre family transcriptional regulator
MIKCNLSVLLAERNLKITKVANDTGISRTTLTSLSNNYSQGIQLDTLNTLCMYFNITPDQFFVYIPIDIRVKTQANLRDNTVEIELTVREKGKDRKLNLFGNVYTRSNLGHVDDIQVDIGLYDATEKEEIQKNADIKRVLKMLPPLFLFDKIEDSERIMDDCNIEFSMDFL